MEKKGKFDYILLETTGLADPAPVASIFWMDEELGSDIYLDGVVTVVDAKHGLESLREERPENAVNEAVKQVALADVILLNKVDVVEDRAAVRGEIRRVNSWFCFNQIHLSPFEFLEEMGGCAMNDA